MKQFLSFFIFALVCISAYAQEDSPLNKKEFLYKYYFYKDANPIWQEEADEINNLFKKILEQDFEEEDRNSLRNEALLLVYSNTVSEYEDAVDIKRMTIRQSMSFATLALIAGENNFRPFLEYAEHSFWKLCDYEEYICHTQKLMLKLIHLLILEHSMNDVNHEEYLKRLWNEEFDRVQIEIIEYLNQNDADIDNLKFKKELKYIIEYK